MSNPELIYYNGFKLNEAMFWDEKTGILYFVAIRNNLIYALDPETLKVKTYKTDGPVGGAVIDKNGRIIEAEKSGIYSIDPVTGEKSFIVQILPHKTMRYNHLIIDSKGRILVDVMGDEERHAGEGGLYEIDGNKVKCLVSGTTVANGMTLNKDETKLYFTDTPTKKVMEYNYDIETGDITNGRVVVSFGEEEKGVPDGVMLDRDEKHLVIAEWNSGKLSIWEIDTGNKVGEISLPSAHATSTVIGGKNRDCIFVATAKREETDESPAGGIFKISI